MSKHICKLKMSPYEKAQFTEQDWVEEIKYHHNRGIDSMVAGVLFVIAWLAFVYYFFFR